MSQIQKRSAQKSGLTANEGIAISQLKQVSPTSQYPPNPLCFLVRHPFGTPGPGSRRVRDGRPYESWPVDPGPQNPGGPGSRTLGLPKEPPRSPQGPQDPQDPPGPQGASRKGGRNQQKCGQAFWRVGPAGLRRSLRVRWRAAFGIAAMRHGALGLASFAEGPRGARGEETSKWK